MGARRRCLDALCQKGGATEGRNKDRKTSLFQHGGCFLVFPKVGVSAERMKPFLTVREKGFVIIVSPAS
jgi:hypothetical protein